MEIQVIQYCTFTLSAGIVLGVALGIYKSPRKVWSLLVWALYGIVDMAYYVAILRFEVEGHILSSVRSVILASIVLFQIWLKLLDNFWLEKNDDNNNH